jgi:hypothetical protein
MAALDAGIHASSAETYGRESLTPPRHQRTLALIHLVIATLAKAGEAIHLTIRPTGRGLSLRPERPSRMRRANARLPVTRRYAVA